ncbi:unnamed protein product [Caenorhabditis bovis]|uniref:Mannosyltransferase n=1 Tax=Caenorhabditis bovis TaxID=2654633 RepID=A0A8S1FB67_9PELO|nr:unnamed protein product [Caenorhabditis bovis]
MSIANLNRPADAFEQLETEDGVRQGVCHIRIQQRTGRKTITTVQGIGTEYDLKRIVQYLKKVRILKMRPKRLLVFLFLFRIASVFVVSSWFVPDEVYQSAEVAHHLVYGTGHLTWEWQTALRSYLHPALIAMIYQFLNLIGFGNYRQAIYYGPRIFHAILFAFGDFSFYHLCRKQCITTSIANLSFISYMSSWFVFYCAPRTLSNSLETCLTLIALNWYPFDRDTNVTWPYIAFGAVTIVIRPTVALLWLVLGLYHLYHHPRPINYITHTVLPVVIPIFAVSFAIDSYAYGTPTIPLYNFLKFNVLQGGSAEFGVHSWHWYFTTGLPTVMTIQLAPVVLGILGQNIFRPTMLPFFAVTFYLLVHSILPHKEQRFLLPIIPLLCLYAGGAFLNLKRMLRTGVVVMILVNAGIAIFTARYHQIGNFMAPQRILEEWDGKENLSIAALTPCYSVPGYSYFHNDIANLRMLDCSPDLNKTRVGLDEADEFHEDVKHSCNGTIVEHPEYGEVIQLTGDQREKVKDFLIKVGIVNESNCRVHGF